MNRSTLVLTVALGLALPLAAPIVAQAAIPSNAPVCGAQPAVATRLVNPLAGALDIAPQPFHIELEAYVPAGSPGVPSLSDERVVLADEEPWATEGGILALDPVFVTWPDAPAVSLDSSLSAQGEMRFVTTWVPALRARTQYTVRLQPAYGPNCIYETVGSFTTGSYL